MERLYGLSREDFEQLLADQDHVCAICGSGHELHVDHCHVGGHVRGLLCSQCNTALGLLRENPAVIESAARYVRARSA